MSSNEISFDKVFNVPQVPGHVDGANNNEETNRSTESSDNSIDELRDSDGKEGEFFHPFMHLKATNPQWLEQLFIINLQMLLNIVMGMVTLSMRLRRAAVSKIIYSEPFQQPKDER